MSDDGQSWRDQVKLLLLLLLFFFLPLLLLEAMEATERVTPLSQLGKIFPQ